MVIRSCPGSPYRFLLGGNRRNAVYSALGDTDGNAEIP